MLLRLSFLVFLLAIVGCSSEKLSNELLKVNFLDPVTFELNGTYLNDYNRHCCLVSFDDELIAGYNLPSRSIDIFDLTTRKPLGQFFLGSEGPDAIGSLNNFYLINKNEAIVVTKNELIIVGLSLVNNEVTITKRFDLRDFEDYPINGFDYDNYLILKQNTFGFMTGLEDRLAVDHLNNRVFLPKYHSTINDFDTAYFEGTLGGWLNLESSTFEDVNIRYPKYLLENGTNIPFLYNIQPLVVNSELVYSFSAVPSIFSYDTPNQKTFEHELPETAKTNFTSNPLTNFKGVSWEDVNSAMRGIEYNFNSVQHFQPIWDSYRKVYYRISKVKGTEGNKSFTAKRFGNHMLTVLDESFNLLSVVEWPDNYDATILVLEDMLLVPLKDQSAEDAFELGRIELTWVN